MHSHVTRATTSSTTAAVPPAAALALLLTLGAFWSTWIILPGIWNADRSHGFVAAGLSAWLLWRNRTQLAAGGRPWRAALPVLVVLSLLWLAAVVVSAEVVQIAVLPLLLVGWLLAVFGRRVLPWAWPIAAVFFLAVPLWEVLVWPLQMLTVLFNAVLLKVVDLQATIRGETISIPSGTLVVAGSCSGINYLMTAVTIATVYAMLFVRQWSTRWRIVALAAFLAMLANWIRVFGLVVIAHVTQMQSPLMANHSTYGWIIFATAMVLFFALATRSERRERAQGTGDGLPDHESTHHPSALHTSTGAASTDNAPAPASPGVKGPGLSLSALVLATVAAVSGPLILLAIGAVPTSPDGVTRAAGVSVDVPLTTASMEASRWQPAFSAATSRYTGDIVRAGAVVQVDRVVYSHEDHRAELLGHGNRISVDSAMLSERLVGPLDDASRIVRQAVVRDGQGARLVWYWYRVADVITASATKARLLELIAFVRRTPTSELIAVSTPCAARDCGSAVAALHAVVTGREMPAPPAR